MVICWIEQKVCSSAEGGRRGPGGHAWPAKTFKWPGNSFFWLDLACVHWLIEVDDVDLSLARWWVKGWPPLFCSLLYCSVGEEISVQASSSTLGNQNAMFLQAEAIIMYLGLNWTQRTGSVWSPLRTHTWKSVLKNGIWSKYYNLFDIMEFLFDIIELRQNFTTEIRLTMTVNLLA